jgi:hypothetical protein
MSHAILESDSILRGKNFILAPMRASAEASIPAFGAGRIEIGIKSPWLNLCFSQGQKAKKLVYSGY